MTKKAPILLIGSYGRGNIGDDAFLLAALQLFPGHELYINSADDTLLPAAVRGKVTTIATASGSGLMNKLRTFARIKHIVYNGGDLWVELYGDRFPRQSLYKMVIVNLLARLCGKKVFYMGCGIGKLTGYSLWLARLSARLANAIVVREQRSADVLALPHVQVLPDLVTNLDIAPVTKSSIGKPFTIGISLLYHLPNPEQNFPRLVKILTAIIDAMPQDSVRVVLFPMLASPHETHDDVWASEQLQAALPGRQVTIFAGREVDEYVAALRDVDVLVGARLHANIIALLAGVPSIGISYRPKVAQFFAMYGLADYCLELDTLSADQLLERIGYIQANYAAVTDTFLGARAQTADERTGYQTFIANNF
jgi:polysaccharide pyruvyl transferase WcaK-like protein